ncbi:hypothetical protein C8R45DRAFT_1178870 [Mycena sanguinolenta]|nr:hypothetical protein C8R45DRAFT_1178870 [Mycena sanguinolenta]
MPSAAVLISVPTTAAALQPAMRILNRPSPSNTPAPAPVPSTSNTAAEGLKEREARYAAVQERIFGAEDKGKEREIENKEKRQSERKENGAGVVRNPKGPSEGEGGGFGGKRRPPNARRSTGGEEVTS